MKCTFCGKKLRSDNKIGACRKHRSISNARKAYMSEYADANFERIKEYKKEWAEENRERLNAKYLERLKDPQRKIAHALRTRINTVMRGRVKPGSAVRDVGCTAAELKQHLESQFQEGMTWDNHGRNGWHIDHIKPLSSFDLTCKEQFLEACHYTNLQPLWEAENIRKRDSLEYKHPRVSDNLTPCEKVDNVC